MYVRANNQQLGDLGWGLSIKSLSKAVTHATRQVGKVASRAVPKPLNQLAARFDRALIRPQISALNRAGSFVDKRVLQPQANLVRWQAGLFDKYSPVIAMVPGPVGLAAKAYVTAKGAVQAVQSYQKQQEAQKRADQAKKSAVQKLRASGYSNGQAQWVINQLDAGADLGQALQQAGPPEQPQPQPQQQQQQQQTASAPGTDGVMASPEQAKQAFMDWLKGFNPAAYNAVAAHGLADIPDSVIDHDTGLYREGLGDTSWLDTVGSWADKVSSVAKGVIGTLNDQKAFDLQLARAKAQLAPAPTAVVQAQAKAMPNPPAQRAQEQGEWPSWVRPVGIGVSVAAAVGIGWALMRKKSGA